MPLPTPAQRPLRDALFCLSLGSLCFIRRWFDLEILQEPSLDFYRTSPRDPKLMIAVISGSLMLACVFWVAAQAVRRADNRRLTAAARCVTLMIIVYAFESMRRYWNSEFRLIDWSSNGIVIALEFALAMGGGMALIGDRRIFDAGRTMVLLAGLLAPALLIDFAWGHPPTDKAAFQALPGLPLLAKRPPRNQHPAPRVVWLLFDEFDQHLAFDERPSGLDLPVLDRMRRESLVANRVLQTADATVLAVPSLLSGEAFERIDYTDARTLLVQPRQQRESPWRDQPNVFEQARQIGANSSLVGWQLPYCRLIGDLLAHCFDQPGGHPPSALLREIEASESSFGDTLEFLFFMQFENLLDLFRPLGAAVSPDIRDTFVQRRQLRQFLAIRDRAQQEVADASMDFVFVHFPTPHLFAIYDRTHSDFAVRPDTSYLDNLALVDRTVGEIRRTLEQRGEWESTTLMVTSDHALRPAMWHNRHNWSPQFEQLIGPGASRTVPFILRLAGNHDGAVYEPSVSNVVTAQLSLAALRGDVSTPQEAVAWLSEHGRHPLLSAR